MKLLITKQGKLTFIDDKGIAHKRVPPKFNVSTDEVFIEHGSKFMTIRGTEYKEEKDGKQQIHGYCTATWTAP